MAETGQTPEKAPAENNAPEVKKTPEHSIISSIIEKRDFSEAEIALVDTRLKFLEDKVKDGLKNKEAKLTLTPEKIAELKADLAREGAGDEKKLTEEKVANIIDESDFEKKPTTAAEAMVAPLAAVGEGIKALKEGKPEEALKVIDRSGIFPDGIFKKFFEWFHNIFGDNRISFDQSNMFDRKVLPAIEALGINIKSESPNDRKDTKVSVMQKLAELGVPLEDSDKYFQFIHGDITEADVPAKVLQLFREGRDQYDKSVERSLSSDPKTALGAILNFVPTKAEIPTANAPDKKAESSPTTAEKVKIGDKEIPGTPEEISAYTALEKTAKNILGKTFDAKSSLTAVKQGTESELTTISRYIFYQIVSKLKATYGENFADSLTGKDITEDDKKLLKLDYSELNKKTPKTMADTLEKNLGNIFWSGVKSLETTINTWAGEDTKKKEIAQKLLQSIKGYQSKEGEKGAPVFQSEIAKGYDKLIAQNIGQTSEWKTLRTNTLKDTATADALIAYYTANPTLEILETV
ncbi:MAG: hypothetical protein WC753_03995 [Candidatus Gracilibacteria bacterium]